MTPEEQAAAEEAEKKKQQQQSLLSFLPDWLNPSTWFSGGFSFGGILQMLIIAVVGYFVASSETVQKWVGENISSDFAETIRGFTNKISLGIKSMMGEELTGEDMAAAFNDMSFDDALKHLKGNVPDGVYDVLTKNKETFEAFQATVKKANGGKLTKLPDDLFNAKTITALVASNPALVGDVLASLTKATGKNLSENDKKMVGQAKEAFKAVVNSEQLDEWVNAKNRKTTVAMLKKIAPEAAGTIDGLLAKGLDKNGKPTPELRAMLTAMIDTMGAVDANGKPVKLPDGAALGVATMLLGDKNKPALLQLKQDLGGRFGDFAAALQAKDGSATIHCMKSENRPAVFKFANAIDLNAVTDAGMKEQLQTLKDISHNKNYANAVTNLANHNLDATKLETFFPAKAGAAGLMAGLANPEAQNFIAKAGTQNVAVILAANAPSAKAVLTQNNLDVLLAFGKTKAGGTQNSKVLGALMAMMVNHDAGPMAALKHNEISSYFSNEANATAFKTMLDGLKISGPNANVLNVLRQHWGTTDDGLLEVLCDPKSVARFPTLIANAGKKQDIFDDIKAFFVEPKNIKDNDDDLRALGSAIAAAESEAAKLEKTKVSGGTHVAADSTKTAHAKTGAAPKKLVIH